MIINMVSKFLASCKKSDFILTGAGVATAQLIALFSTPYLARVVGPEAFGEYNYYLAALAMLGVLGTVKLEYGVYSSTNLIRKYYLVLSTLFVFLLSSAILFLSSIFFEWDWGISVLLFMSLLSVFLFDFYIQSNVFNGDFKSNSLARVFRAVFFVVAVFIIGLLNVDDVEIVLVAYIASNVLPLVKFILINLNLQVRRLIVCKSKVRLVFISLLRVRNVIFFLTPAHFLNRYSISIVIVLSERWGVGTFEEIAFYALAFKLMVSPANIIVVSLSDVIKKYAIESPRYAIKKYKSLMRFNVLISLFVLLVLHFIPEAFLIYFLGAEWEGIKEYFYLVFPFFFALLVFSPLSQVYLVFNKQKIDFFVQVAFSILLTLSFFIGSLSNFRYGVVAYSLTYLLVTVLSFLYCYKILSDYSEKEGV